MYDERLPKPMLALLDDDEASEPTLDEMRAALAVLAVLSMDDAEEESLCLH